MNTTTNRIKSKREAFATHYGLDYADTEDYRYQYGRTTQPVWVVNDKYITVSKVGQAPAKHRNGIEWNWEEIKDEFINRDGWIIWESQVKIN